MEKEVLRRIDEEWSNEEKFWRQRSHFQLLKHRDCNTRFFHLTTVVHGQRNRLLKLRKLNSQWTENETEIQAEILQFFTHLFQRQQCSNFEEILCHMQPVVTEA